MTIRLVDELPPKENHKEGRKGGRLPITSLKKPQPRPAPRAPAGLPNTKKREVQQHRLKLRLEGRPAADASDSI